LTRPAIKSRSMRAMLTCKTFNKGLSSPDPLQVHATDQDLFGLVSEYGLSCLAFQTF
jgi:hypothetical protein